MGSPESRRNLYNLPIELLLLAVLLIAGIVFVNVVLFRSQFITSVGSITSDSLMYTVFLGFSTICALLIIIIRQRMLAEFRIHQEKLLLTQMYEERFRLTIDNAPIGMALVTLDGHFLRVNQVLCEMLSYSYEELLTIKFPDIVHPGDTDKDRELLERLLRGDIPRYQITKRYLRKDGGTLDVMLSMSLVRDHRGAPVHLVAQLEDITERKRAEEQVRYLSLHDKLTGLYNRAYLEEELRRIDAEGQVPLSLIIGDVNGLKLVNDAFGHQEGDRLLCKMARILQNSCQGEEIVARWGGDEFAILLPRGDKKKAREMCERIRKATGEVEEDPIRLSIALGATTRENPTQSVHELLREAEDWMYREKLIEGKSVRSLIISSLRKALSEKTCETAEHPWRLQNLLQELGRRLGVSEAELDELAHLAVLHDIGKVAIPDDILMKPGNLSPQEWEIMRRHPEVGYRIVASSYELAHMAEAILCHHERWDGTGYPQGLRGEEIPLASRMIAVVDAYDAMTYGRPYKEPMGRREALEELKKGAGKQFDPKLVEVFIDMIEGQEAELLHMYEGS